MVVFENISEELAEAIVYEKGYELATEIVNLLREEGKVVAFAESCTGGFLAKRITDIPGSSEVFNCSIVSYTNEIKNKVLGVREKTLYKFTAVSRECAMEMANGVRMLSGADYGVSVTGYAGNGDGDEVGVIYIGLSSEKGTSAILLNTGIRGDNCREKNRMLAVRSAFNNLKEMIISDASVTTAVVTL